MKIFGNICVGLIALGIVWMFGFLSQSVSQYDYIVAGFLSLGLLICFLALFVAIVATGKLDFLGWPRLLQFGVAVLACLSLTVVMGMSAALHGSGGNEFRWSIQPFCPWAAIAIPLSIAVIGALWLNSERLAVPARPLRVAFGFMTAIALVSNLVFGLEIRSNLRHQADEQARNDLAFVQQTDPEKDFCRLLHYSSRFERPPIRQLALEKILATGPGFNALMIECLKTPMFEEGLTYLRDNDPPGDAAPLAEPARDGIFLSAERLRGEIATGRPVKADEVESRVDSVLTVADKFSKYGVDFLPAVGAYRAALNAPKNAEVPPSSLKKMDAWLASKSR